MSRHLQHVAHHSMLERQHVVAAADRPGRQEEGVGDFIATEILERQVLVTVLDRAVGFVGKLLADQRRGDVAPAGDASETIVRPARRREGQQEKQQEHSLDGFHDRRLRVTTLT